MFTMKSSVSLSYIFRSFDYEHTSDFRCSDVGVLSSDALLPEQTYIEFLQTLKATRPNLDVSDLNVQCDSISHATKEFRPLYGAFR